MGDFVESVKFKSTPAGWVADPAGEEFTVTHEAGGLVYLANAAGVGFAVPRASLSAPAVVAPKPKGV